MVLPVVSRLSTCVSAFSSCFLVAVKFNTPKANCRYLASSRALQGADMCTRISIEGSIAFLSFSPPFEDFSSSLKTKSVLKATTSHPALCDPLQTLYRLRSPPYSSYAVCAR